MGSFHLRPPVFVMPSDASLPIIDLTYRPVLEVDRAVGEFPRSQRAGLPAARRSRSLRPAGGAGRGALRPRPREAGASGGSRPKRWTACACCCAWPPTCAASPRRLPRLRRPRRVRRPCPPSRRSSIRRPNAQLDGGGWSRAAEVDQVLVRHPHLCGQRAVALRRQRGGSGAARAARSRMRGRLRCNRRLRSISLSAPSSGWAES